MSALALWRAYKHCLGRSGDQPHDAISGGIDRLLSFHLGESTAENWVHHCARDGMTGGLIALNNAVFPHC